MTALRRMTLKALSGLAAALALCLSVPALAQNNDAPVDVTAAPPPSAESVGPSQLRDFNLQGTVTRPADRPAATPTQPAAEPEEGDAAPSETARQVTGTSEASPRSAAPQPSEPSASNRPAVSVNAPSTQAPAAPSLPLEVTTGPTRQPGYDSDAGVTLTPDSGGDLLSLPWIAALLALMGGGAAIAWGRRSRRRAYGDPGRMAFAGPTPDAVPETDQIPWVHRRPAPVPSSAEPRPSPRPDPTPRTAPQPAVKPVDDGLIVSSRLKPQLNVEFQPDRVLVTEQDVVLQFDIVLANTGSAPARDVLVEGRLFTAHIGQDREIAEFFQNPVAQGDRITSIAPLGRISLKSVARLPLDQVQHFEAGGRKLFVPMIGFNVLYRAGASESQASASFLVGRGSEEDEKLAPFRIDQGPRIFRGLSARSHSIGLQPA